MNTMPATETRPAYLRADGSYDFSSREIRCYVNDFATDAYVLVVHGDEGDFVGAACDTWADADERRDEFEDLFCDVIEVAPGETLDLNIWG